MIIVLTGGIGSGKSQVCRILSEDYGFHVYEADARVKELYNTHPELLSRIEVALGASFRNAEGDFVPSSLAQVIFCDANALETVESLVFPVLIDDFNTWMSGITDDLPVIFESATVLEKPQFKGFGDKVILVDAPFQTRLERASRRDGVAKNMIYSRMMNQVMMNKISDGEIDPDTDAVIHNDCTLDELHQQVLLTIERLYGKIN
jgi:dephospho-CoA kinase